MTTLCSLVIIIIEHKNTKYYCNPFIIFITHVLSKITIVYIICVRGVMVIVVGNGNGDTSSNAGPG